MIATVLAWLGAKRWLLELAGAAVIVAGLLWYHHSVYTAGIAAQQAADAAASAKLETAAAVQTEKLKAAADAAEHAHDDELASLRAYRDSHPAQPVRLCLNAPAGARGVPEAPAAHSGDAGAGASPARLQPMHPGDPGLRAGTAGPDIGAMLGALGAAADRVSAQLREFQAREP